MPSSGELVLVQGMGVKKQKKHHYCEISEENSQKNYVVLRWIRTRDLALHVDWCKRLFKLAFFRLMMSSALVKLLSGRTP